MYFDKLKSCNSLAELSIFFLIVVTHVLICMKLQKLKVT